jgi:hypothetical protein
MYLGDGCLSEGRRSVYKLRITLDKRYPNIIRECQDAIREVRGPDRVTAGIVPKQGCVEVYANWKHWPCLFPQHAAGVKHLRVIQLEPWQEEIVTAEPGRLLRGLIHSDGCRITNRVKVRGVDYAYPRYQFNNTSEDIRRIFCKACDDFGVRWAQSNWNTISVSRSASIAKLDEVIGPKT